MILLTILVREIKLHYDDGLKYIIYYCPCCKQPFFLAVVQLFQIYYYTLTNLPMVV